MHRVSSTFNTNKPGHFGYLFDILKQNLPAESMFLYGKTCDNRHFNKILEQKKKICLFFLVFLFVLKTIYS